MAGNKNSGRNRKPIDVRIAEGTYKPSRHGTLPIEPVAAKPLRMPPGLEDDEKAEWKRITSIKHLDANDYSLALAACQLWSLYLRALKRARRQPFAKEVRCAVTGYFTQYRNAVITLGIPPNERAKLSVMSRQSAKTGVRSRSRA